MRSNKTAARLKLNTFVSANIYIFTKRSEMFTLQKWKSFICATKIVIFSWCGPVYGTCVRRGKFGKHIHGQKLNVLLFWHLPDVAGYVIWCACQPHTWKDDLSEVMSKASMYFVAIDWMWSLTNKTVQDLKLIFLTFYILQNKNEPNVSASSEKVRWALCS